MLKKMRNLQLRKDKKNQKGFTLVELMATLGILALIVAIAVPAIGGIMDKASDSAEDSDKDMLVKSAEIAYATDASNDDGVFEIKGTGDERIVTTTAGDLESAGFLDFDEASSLEVEDSVTKTGDKPFTMD